MFSSLSVSGPPFPPSNVIFAPPTLCVEMRRLNPFSSLPSCCPFPFWSCFAGLPTTPNTSCTFLPFLATSFLLTPNPERFLTAFMQRVVPPSRCLTFRGVQPLFSIESLDCFTPPRPAAYCFFVPFPPLCISRIFSRLLHYTNFF